MTEKNATILLVTALDEIACKFNTSIMTVDLQNILYSSLIKIILKYIIKKIVIYLFI